MTVILVLKSDAVPAGMLDDVRQAVDGRPARRRVSRGSRCLTAGPRPHGDGIICVPKSSNSVPLQQK
jgi:hypothetical protein